MGYLKTIDKDSVRDLLSSLFGKPCVVAKEKTPKDPTKGMYVRGRFVDDTGELVALTLSDLPFAAFSGAAIAMLPPGGAEDAVDEKELSGTLEDAYSEVLNVLSRLFNTEGRPHCRYTTMEKAPLEDCEMEAKESTLFRVEVDGYGTGHLLFLAG
ncbi:MAG: hypothetical protein JKY37_14235 [Nannocystaceae bacterium]|nr:hypothetical protein [Nannocystaceae bacterium]